ncbi:MAG: hypothetical protein ACE369_21080 [Roseovarius sp.]
MKGPGDLSSCERAEPRASSHARPRGSARAAANASLLAATLLFAACGAGGDGISRTGTDPVSLDRVITLNDSICDPPDRRRAWWPRA